MNERDLLFAGIGSGLTFVAIYGFKRLEDYLAKKSVEVGKNSVASAFEELKREGLLQFIPKQNPGNEDLTKVYKLIEDLSYRVSQLENKF